MVAVALGVGFGTGTEVVVAVDDFDAEEAEALDVVVLEGPTVATELADAVEDPRPEESALAGTHAATDRTTTTDPTAGQWRSGRRIMRWDKHFHSATPLR
jgi:hypothetical protein